MKRLLIMRHAKSSWDEPDRPDHDRPLNDRGRRTAPRMGAWLAEQGLVPDLALVSSATRAQQTWELVAGALPCQGPARTEPGIYEAEPETLVEILHGTPDEAATVIMVGHEPGVSEFARLMASDPVPAALARAFGHFPTAAVAAIEFDTGSWRSVNPGRGRFTVFVTPKDLD
jgi:phosphohistidine phosphatase